MTLRRTLAAAAAGLLAGLTLLAGTAHAGPDADTPRGSVDRTAAPAGWYMLVNDLYDNPKRCLSANNSTPPGGSPGTHQVYLALCNQNTDAQWWLLPSAPFGFLRNLAAFSGSSWCLSKNYSTPSGGGAGTHAAYTAVCNSNTREHRWGAVEVEPFKIGLLSEPQFEGRDYCLSASSSNPYPPAGTYRVYGAGCSLSGAQLWRPFQP